MKTNLELANETQTTGLSPAEFAAVQKILQEELEVAPDQITPGAELRRDLGADSLTEINLIMRLEEQLHITLDDEATEQVKTVAEVHQVVAKALKR